MRAQRIFAAVLGFAVSPLAMPVLTGCNMPGRPQPGPEVPRPDAVTSFDTLYGENCAGCHGKNGDNGAATNLANPEYQGLIDDVSMRDVIANGKQGSLMPGFSIRRGGPLTEGQIDAIVQGLRARWKKENPFGGETPPPYKASHAGDASRGLAVYAAACARCHGETAQHPGSAGSILDGSFLALINEQTVRTTIIAGRPDIGEPDWRNHIPGRAMTDDEITDVSAWLIAQRPTTPGQPYPNAKPSSQLRGEAQPLANKATGPTKPNQP
jgi:cytochrome c oxidase cbb3-type subunit 3/ubiquinol-cytochrome c reductase cytochrome c subunit